MRLLTGVGCPRSIPVMRCKTYFRKHLVSSVMMVALLSLVECKNPSSEEKASGKFDAAKAQAMLTAGARILDVRTPGEFAGGHLKGALNIPVQDLLTRMDELKPLDKPIIVYCQSGRRSASAKGMLEQSGFKTVVDIGTQRGWPLK